MGARDSLLHIVQELLYNNSLSVDGSKIETTGFKYEVPEPTVEVTMATP